MGYSLNTNIYSRMSPAADRPRHGGMVPRICRFCRRLLTALLVCALLLPSVAPGRAVAWGAFTLKDEMELGRKFNVLIRSNLPLVQDPEVVEYIGSIVARLSKNMPPQPFPFTSSVIRHNAVNAFACPGGYIFVHTGLILAMEHEAELAGVIAHELAHVTQHHIARRIENSQWISILSMVGALAGAFIGGEGGTAAIAGSMAAGQAAMLNYSRSDEAEADQVGMSYLTKGGYPPRGMVGAFEIMGRRQWIMGSSIPTYLSTHPGVADRVKDMGVRVQNLPANIRNKKDDDVQFLRIQALVRARYSDPQPAGQIFTQQLDGPNRCMALMGQGILAARQNKINDAASAFDSALACAPDDQLIIREAGRFHYTKGNKNRGMELLNKAVSLNRNDTMALFYYARSLADSGDNAKAIEYTHEVLRIVPEDSEVHTLLARYYANVGNMFNANLHMAYGALYSNNKKRVEQFFSKAKELAKSPEEKGRVERFETAYEDRKEFW